MNTKSIVIASNPFGYGPTGKAVAIIKKLELLLDSKDVNIYFIGSGLCLELINKLDDTSIKVVSMNERSIADITDFLLTLRGHVVTVAVQNRFLPKASKALNIDSFFIDGLAWFWDELSPEHLHADHIYWTNFLNLQYGDKKVPPGIKLICLPHEEIARTESVAKYSIVSLGGCTNPLVDGLQRSYLKLAAKVFDIVARKLEMDIHLVCGTDAAAYLNALSASQNYSSLLKFQSLSHEEMMTKFSGCYHHFSVGGQTSSFESIVSGIPTTFFLPSNLSQIRFQEYVSLYISGEITMNWYTYVEDCDAKLDNEKDAIRSIEVLAGQLLEQDKDLERCAAFCIRGVEINEPRLEREFKKLCDPTRDVIYDDIMLALNLQT